MSHEKSSSRLSYERAKRVLPEEVKVRIKSAIAVIEGMRAEVIDALASFQDVPKEHMKTLKALGSYSGALRSSLNYGSDPDQSFDSYTWEASFAQQVDLLRAEVARLGLSSRTEVKALLEKGFNWDKYWYTRAFKEPELEIMNLLFKKHIGSGGDFKSLDLGIGHGRVSELALETMGERMGKGASKLYAENIYGVDLTVENARDNLGDHGVPRKNIVKGDFTQLPEYLMQGKFTHVWCMMNTLFYMTTEDDLAKVLKNIERSLSYKGVFLFDTLELTYHEGVPPSDSIARFEDLTSLYTVLVRIYKELFIDPSLSEAESRKSIGRYPILSNTTGIGYYPREVITLEYLQYVIRSHGIRLKLEPEKLPKATPTLNKAESIILGREWIDQNNIEQWLRREIAFRLRQIDKGKSIIRPFYTLPLGKRVTTSRKFNPIVGSSGNLPVLGMPISASISSITPTSSHSSFPSIPISPVLDTLSESYGPHTTSGVISTRGGSGDMLTEDGRVDEILNQIAEKMVGNYTKKYHFFSKI